MGYLPPVAAVCNKSLVERGVAARTLTERRAGWLRLAMGCALLTAAVSLPSCGTVSEDRIKVGMTTGEVRAKAGAPTDQRTLPDGETAWYYVNGPQGSTTFRVRFDAEGRVAQTEQVLTEDNFLKKIKPLYTTRDDLLTDFGRPASIAVFPRMGEEVWQYRFKSLATDMVNDVHVDQSTGVVKKFVIDRDRALTPGVAW